MFTDVFIKTLALVHVILGLLNVFVDIMQLNSIAHLSSLNISGHKLFHGSILLLLVLEMNSNNSILVTVRQDNFIIFPIKEMRAIIDNPQVCDS